MTTTIRPSDDRFRRAAYYVRAISPVIPGMIDSTVAMLMALAVANEHLQQRDLDALDHELDTEAEEV